MVKLIVADEKETALVILFDAAETLIGCPPSDFIESKKKVQKMKQDNTQCNLQKLLTFKIMLQNKVHCKFYRKLILCNGQYFKFFIRMRKLDEQDREKGRFVVHQVEKLEDPETPKEPSTKKQKK